MPKKPARCRTELTSTVAGSEYLKLGLEPQDPGQSLTIMEEEDVMEGETDILAEGVATVTEAMIEAMIEDRGTSNLKIKTKHQKI